MQHAYLLALSRWLADPMAPYALVLAPGEWGKSTLLCQWAAHVMTAEQFDVLYVPALPEFGTNARLGLLRALAAALSCQAGAPDEGEDEAALLAREIRGAIVYRPRPTLLVVDGLSEVEDWPWDAQEEPLFPPGPDSMIKVLVAARPLPGDEGGRTWLRRLCWPRVRPLHLSALSESDWSDMIAIASPSLAYLRDRTDVLQRLYQNSFGGNPCLLHDYRRALLDLGERGAFLTLDAVCQHVAERVGKSKPPRILQPPREQVRHRRGYDVIPASPPARSEPTWKRLMLASAAFLAVLSAVLFAWQLIL